MPTATAVLTIAITVAAHVSVDPGTLPASIGGEPVEVWQVQPLIGDNEPGGSVVLVRPCDACPWVPLWDADWADWGEHPHTQPDAPDGLVASTGGV